MSRCGWNYATFSKNSWRSRADVPRQCTAYPLHNARPVAETRLPKKTCGRVPGALLAIEEPTKIWKIREKNPHRLCHRSRNVNNRCIYRNHQVQK